MKTVRRLAWIGRQIALGLAWLWLLVWIGDRVEDTLTRVLLSLAPLVLLLAGAFAWALYQSKRERRMLEKELEQ